jgi:hypothetical protein
MSEIFNYISYDKVIHIDDYNKNQLIYNFSDVIFRTHISSHMSFFTPLGVFNNKIISLTNKQFSFLFQKYNNFLGNEYATELKNTYDKIQTNIIDNILTIDEPVFQFFDYESVNGTGHSYDLMFYLLYHYKINNLSSKLLVVESSNKYYNHTLEIIKKYFNIDYIYIKPCNTYLFKNFSCTRTYQNIFFNEVKNFININLIQPIINKYEEINETYYDDIIKIKYENPNSIDRLNISFKKTKLFNRFCSKKNIFDLNDVDDNEELKIYLLNKAKIIRINWGSAYYININYYLQNTQDKFISVIFHKNIMDESRFLNQISLNTFNQNMPGEYSANITNHVYNNWTFEGEKIENIKDTDEYILRTKI